MKRKCRWNHNTSKEALEAGMNSRLAGDRLHALIKTFHVPLLGAGKLLQCSIPPISLGIHTW